RNPAPGGLLGGVIYRVLALRRGITGRGARFSPHRRRGAAMAGAGGVQMDGPLVPFAAGFGESLAAAGYSQGWARQLMDLMAEVSHWLGAGGLRARDLTGEVVGE